MADDKRKPRINVTRGSKKASRTTPAEQENRSGSINPETESTGLMRRAREVWLAGLGALSVAGDQGTKLYRALVEEGKRWEKNRRETAGKGRKRGETQREDTSEAAAEGIDAYVVRRVREGVDATLDRAGVPTQSTLDDLREQVEVLTRKADRLIVQLEETRGDGTSS